MEMKDLLYTTYYHKNKPYGVVARCLVKGERWVGASYCAYPDTFDESIGLYHAIDNMCKLATHSMTCPPRMSQAFFTTCILCSEMDQKDAQAKEKASKRTDIYKHVGQVVKGLYEEEIGTEVDADFEEAFEGLTVEDFEQDLKDLDTLLNVAMETALSDNVKKAFAQGQEDNQRLTALLKESGIAAQEPKYTKYLENPAYMTPEPDNRVRGKSVVKRLMDLVKP